MKLIYKSCANLCLSIILISSGIEVQAADDLLDPGKIGAARKSAADSGLLDPTALATKMPLQGSSIPLSPITNTESPGAGRSMASSVVSSMNGLTQAAADMIDKVKRLDAEARDLQAKIARLSAEKEAKDALRNNMRNFTRI